MYVIVCISWYMYFMVYVYPVLLLACDKNVTSNGCIHSLDWTTGMDYWIELFSFFGQVSVFDFRKKA